MCPYLRSTFFTLLQAMIAKWKKKKFLCQLKYFAAKKSATL
jgi:hypothetical protein